MSKKTLILSPLGLTWSDFTPVVRFEGDGLQPQISALTSVIFDPENPLSVSKTQQNFADETDINNIIAQYEKTGIFTHVNPLQPRYGDTTFLPEFQAAQNIIAQATQAFAELPARVRERFHNDPEKFVAYLSEPGHDAELRELGLLPPLSLEAPGEGDEASLAIDSSAAIAAPKGARKASSEANKTPSE